MMIAEFIKRMHHGNQQKDTWFWRDSNGNEIDFLTANGMRLTIVGSKAGLTIMPAMFRGLEYFEQIPGLKNLNKLLVYGGNSVRNRKAGKVISWNKFGEE